MNQNPILQRLIGAVVVISLAIIFIPMFLGGEGELADILHQSNIPEAPVYEFKTLPEPDEQGLHTAVEQVTAGKIVEDDVDVHGGQATEADSPAQDQAKPTAGEGGSSTAVQIPQASADTRPEPVAPMASPAKPAETGGAAPVAPSHEQGWSVQVASFSEKNRALAFRDRLREKKFVAYVESVKLASSTAYRVRVGPEKSHADAQSLQARLKKQMQLDGIVVQH